MDTNERKRKKGYDTKNSLNFLRVSLKANQSTSLSYNTYFENRRQPFVLYSFSVRCARDMTLQQRGLKICIATGLVVSCIGSFTAICTTFAPPTTTMTMIGLSAVRTTPSSQRCRHLASSTFRRILPSFQTGQSTTAHAAPADDTGATPPVPSGTTADIDIDTTVPPLLYRPS